MNAKTFQQFHGKGRKVNKAKKVVKPKPVFVSVKGSYDLLVGIDPSGKKTEVNKNGSFKRGNIGLCITDPKGNIQMFDTVNFFECQKILSKLKKDNPTAKILVVVENPDGQTVFKRAGINNKYTIGKQHRDLGKNQKCSNLIAAWCRHLLFSVKEISPKEKGAKWSPELFFSVSKFDKSEYKKYQEHSIDAYQMIHKYFKK